MADEIKAAEARGYSKGYAAGKRRIESEDEIEARRQRHKQEREQERLRWDGYFCAAMTGTIQSGGWRTGETPWKTAEDYVRGCAKIADAMMEESRKRYG
jgi:hypothetical protein